MHVVVFTIFFEWSGKEHFVGKILLALSGKFLYENNSNFNFYKFSDELAFVSFSYFRKNQKQKPYFYEFGGLVMKNISLSCL